MQVPYKLPGSQYVQWVDLYTRMAFDRIVFLDEEIDDNFANFVVALMLSLSSEDASKPIYLYINSPGERISRSSPASGLVASMAIYDTMQYIKPPIHTICLGQAAGTAALLLAAGTPGLRMSLPNAEIVLSPQMARSRGQATDIQIDAQKVIADRAMFVEILSSKTGQPTEKIVQDLDRRLYFTPQMAQEYGLLDRVLESPKQLPKAMPVAL